MMYEQLLPSCSLSQSYVELCLLQPLNKLIASENHYYYLFLVNGTKNIKIPFCSPDSTLSEYIIFKILKQYLLTNEIGAKILKITQNFQKKEGGVEIVLLYR